MIRWFPALLNDIKRLRLAVSREIFLNHCFPLIGRCIVWNGWLLIVTGFPVVFCRFRFLVHFISLVACPWRCFLYGIYLAVLRLKFWTNGLASCVTGQLLQNRDIPVVNPCRLTVSSEAHRDFINWVETVGYFSGFQMRVIIWVWRQFDDEHVWIIAADAVMTRLASDAFLVVVQRHSSARHPQTCQQFAVRAVCSRRGAADYKRGNQQCQRYKTRKPAKEKQELSHTCWWYKWSSNHPQASTLRIRCLHGAAERQSGLCTRNEGV